MKLYPRLLPSTARSLFGQPSMSPRHPLAPVAPADGVPLQARNLDPSSSEYIPLRPTRWLVPLLGWIAGAGLTTAYAIRFFADLFQHLIR